MKLAQKLGVKARTIMTKFHHNATLIVENMAKIHFSGVKKMVQDIFGKKL
jgi:hypothetical protein